MRLWWNHVWQSAAYRGGSLAERRMIDLRFSVARALKAHRRQKGVTQARLSQKLGLARSTISRVERASKRVTFDVALLCFIALDCSDEEIADAFNPPKNRGIAILRARAQERAYRGADWPCEDYRFVKKKRPRSREAFE